MGLNRNGLDCIVLDWADLDLIGLGSTGPDLFRLNWIRLNGAG